MNAESPDTQLIALIDRVALADESALKELYELTSSKLYGVALRVVRNQGWSEDVLQEAFLTIWRIAGDYKASLSPPMAWLCLIVRSRGLDFLRRRTSERADSALELDDVLSDTVEGDSPNPMDTVLADDKAFASMLVTFDPKNNKLVLKRVGGFQESADKSLELWALPQTGGPKSLGVLGSEKVIRLTATGSDVKEVPTLAITLEPKGGVPPGSGPTGPVLFKGALIQTAL